MAGMPMGGMAGDTHAVQGEYGVINKEATQV